MESQLPAVIAGKLFGGKLARRLIVGRLTEPLEKIKMRLALSCGQAGIVQTEPRYIV